MALVESHIEHLSEVALQAAHEHGLSVASPLEPKKKGSTTAVYVDDSAAVEKRMAARGFIVSARGPVIRVAPHFYNTADEVAGAMAMLSRCA